MFEILPYVGGGELGKSVGWIDRYKHDLPPEIEDKWLEAKRNGSLAYRSGRITADMAIETVETVNIDKDFGLFVRVFFEQLPSELGIYAVREVAGKK